jgi:hypothetical protein
MPASFSGMLRFVIFPAPVIGGLRGATLPSDQSTRALNRPQAGLLLTNACFGPEAQKAILSETAQRLYGTLALSNARLA